MSGSLKFILYIVYAGLFLALLTPFLLYNNLLFPFISTKIFYFRILTEIVLFFYLVLAIYQPKYRPDWKNPLLVSVTLFFFTLTVSSLFGYDLYKSFWGNIERGEGLLTLYHVYVYFLILVSVFKDKNIWLWYFNGAIFVSLLTVGYGIMQDLGVSGVINTTGSRISSTIGNPAFFAGYLLFGIFASLGFFIKSRNYFLKSLYFLFFVVQLFMLFKTETRGSFIAVIVSFLLFAFLLFLFTKNKKIKKISIVSFIVLVFAVWGVWALKDSAFVKNIPILKRMTTISLNDVTTQSRLLTWKSSWYGFKDNMFLGYGLENYNIAFNKYFHPEIFKDSGSQIWFDRAHNIVFDLLVAGGLLAFLFYFPMFILSFYVLYQYWKKTGEYQIPILIVSLLVGYFVQNLFVFDTLSLYISFYALLAYIFYISVFYKLFPYSTRKDTDIISGKNFKVVLVALSLVFVTVSMYYFNIKPIKANNKAIYALWYASQVKDYEKASEIYKEAISMQTYQSTEIRQKYAEFAMDIVRRREVPDDFAKNRLIEAIEYTKENIKEHPYDVQHYLFLMMLYNQMTVFDKSYAQKAVDISEKALSLSPTRPQIYYELGQAYLALSQNDKAIESFKKAVDLQPEARESWWNLAMAYAVINDVENSDKILEKLNEMNYDVYSIKSLSRFIPVYISNKNIDKLIDIYTKFIEIESTNAEWWAKLAALYKEKKDYEKAKEYVVKAVELDPRLEQEAVKFLSTLEGNNDK